MKDYKGIGIAVGPTRKQQKAKRDRADAKALKAFRDACWQREVEKFQPADWNVDPSHQYAECQSCGRCVARTPEHLTGEVHHRISRRHKATRYDPANGVLLCNGLINNCHEKAQRGLIKV